MPHDPALVDASLTNAYAARTAWTEASRHAVRAGVGDLAFATATTLRRARRLLDQALDPATTSAERAVVIDRVIALLNRVCKQPPSRDKVTEVITDAEAHRHAVCGSAHHENVITRGK